MDQETKKKLQIGRALFHASFGVVGLVFAQIIRVRPEFIWATLQFSVEIFVRLDTIRVGIHWTFRLCARWLPQPLLEGWEKVEEFLADNVGLRGKERVMFSAMSSYVAGATFVYRAFEIHIALWAVLVLAFGDPAARIFGILYGRDRDRSGKTKEGWRGFVGAASVALAASGILHLWFPIFPNMGLVGILCVQAVGVVVGAEVERRVPWLDNFFIPVGVGTAMWLTETGMRYVGG